MGDLLEVPILTGGRAPAFRGWDLVGRGVAIGTGRYIVFTDRTSYMIAATETVVLSMEVGKGDIQRITATRIVSRLAGEQEAASCDFITLSPALAFYTGNAARGFFVVGTEIIERRWFADGDCYGRAPEVAR